jgi:hypothetical protein
MKEIKILKVNSRVCWVVFIFAQISLVAFMIATLAVPEWVKLDPDSDSRYKFEGGLLRVTEGLSEIANPLNPLVTADVSENSYIRISCACEFLIDISVKELVTEDFWNFYSSWEELFANLWFAGGFFMVFEIMSVVSTAIVIMTLALMIWGKFYIRLNLCGSICLWISHIIAIIGYLGMLDLTFKDDCDELFDGTDPPTICATTGPTLGIFVLILIPFIMIPYFLVFYSFNKQYNVSQIVESEPEPHNITQINDSKTKSKTKEFS